MENGNGIRKGFRLAPNPSKGEVAQENQKLSSVVITEINNLKQQLTVHQNLLIQLLNQVNQARPEINALTTLAAAPETDSPAQPGDHVMVDFLGVILDAEGNPEPNPNPLFAAAGVPNDFEGGYGSRFVIQRLGAGSLIPGFEDQVVGKKAGDSFDFSVDFPAEYGNKSLAGKKVKFLVQVHVVYRQFPESIVERTKASYEEIKATILAAKAAEDLKAKQAADEAAAQTPASEQQPEAAPQETSQPQE